MPSMTRTFEVPVSEGQIVHIKLHEPSLTRDNLGFKTWTSSVLLARRLISMPNHLPQSHGRVLELGAGTGLVGLAAACAWAASVTLTDLPEILPNLQQNIEKNRKVTQGCGGEACARPLDWSDVKNAPVDDDDRYSVILAADPLYEPGHPKMLVDTVNRWMRRSSEAIFIVELPLRRGYHQERKDLKMNLIDMGLHVTDEGYEIGPEDWQDNSGKQAEVECWWSSWQFTSSAPGSIRVPG